MKVTESFTAVTVYCCVKSSRFWHCSNALALAGDTSTLAKPSTHKSKSLGRLGILPSFSLPLGWWFFDFLRPMSLGCNAKHCCNRQCMAMPSWSLVDDSMTMYDIHELWVFFELSLVWSHLQCRSTTQWLFGWRPGGIRSGASASVVRSHETCTCSMHPPHLKYFTAAERWSFSACSGEIEFLTCDGMIPIKNLCGCEFLLFDMRSVSELPQLWSRTRPDMISSYKFI